MSDIWKSARLDFAVLIVGLFIGISIPLRNKAIREYRKKGDRDNDLQEPVKENDAGGA